MQRLLIEDDADLGDAVAAHLITAGHAVQWCRNLSQARAAAPPSLALLDLGLPDGDGLSLLRSWRAAGQFWPVIVLTARDQVSDRIRGLQAGADDYLVKPFDLEEVSAGLWHETDEVLDSSLAGTAQRLLALPTVAQGAAGADAQGMQLLSPSTPPSALVVYQVFDAGGALPLRSPGAPVRPLDAGAPDGLRAVQGWLVLTASSADGQQRVQVAEALAHRHEVLWASVGWLLVMLLALLPLAAASVDWLLRRAFATLDTARQDLEQRAAALRHAPCRRHRRPCRMRPSLLFSFRSWPSAKMARRLTSGAREQGDARP